MACHGQKKAWAILSNKVQVALLRNWILSLPNKHKPTTVALSNKRQFVLQSMEYEQRKLCPAEISEVIIQKLVI